MKEKHTAIVLAAGSGKRMHSQVQKQYMDLFGKQFCITHSDNLKNANL